MANRTWSNESIQFILDYVNSYEGKKKYAFQELKEAYPDKSIKAIEVCYYLNNRARKVKTEEKEPEEVVTGVHEALDIIKKELAAAVTFPDILRRKDAQIEAMQKRIDVLEAEAAQVAQIFNRVRAEVLQEPKVFKFDTESNSLERRP